MNESDGCPLGSALTEGDALFVGAPDRDGVKLGESLGIWLGTMLGGRDVLGAMEGSVDGVHTLSI